MIADQRLAQNAFYWVAVNWLIIEISGTYMAIPTALQRYGIVAIGNSLSNSPSIVIGLVVVTLGGSLLTMIQALIWSILTMVFWAVCARALLPNVGLLPGWALHRVSQERALWLLADGGWPRRALRQPDR